MPKEQRSKSAPELVWKNPLPLPEIKLLIIQPTCYIVTQSTEQVQIPVCRMDSLVLLLKWLANLSGN
jgi:hypothetical protein